jgi:predicted phosphoribosyltransferase
MMAAVESVRYRQPNEIIVAVPVASAAALPKVEKVANRVVSCVAGFNPEFYVSDFYRYWHDPSDEEVLQCFKEWGLRRRPDLNKLGKKTDS